MQVLLRLDLEHLAYMPLYGTLDAALDQILYLYNGIHRLTVQSAKVTYNYRPS